MHNLYEKFVRIASSRNNSLFKEYWRVWRGWKSRMADIVQLVKIVMERVYVDHSYLIKNQVSERSIVFWFGIYFHEIIQGTEFSEYDLDVEYNRNLRKVKRTEQFKRGTYPDLILHKRGSNDNNILIIVSKSCWNADSSDDIRKLIDFTDPNAEYKYDLGLSVLIGREILKGIIV
jgi:hypothetical protein